MHTYHHEDQTDHSSPTFFFFLVPPLLKVHIRDLSATRSFQLSVFAAPLCISDPFLLSTVEKSVLGIYSFVFCPSVLDEHSGCLEPTAVVLLLRQMGGSLCSSPPALEMIPGCERLVLECSRSCPQLSNCLDPPMLHQLSRLSSLRLPGASTFVHTRAEKWRLALL